MCRFVLVWKKAAAMCHNVVMLLYLMLICRLHGVRAGLCGHVFVWNILQFWPCFFCCDDVCFGRLVVEKLIDFGGTAE